MNRPPHENPFRVDRTTALPFIGRDVPSIVDVLKTASYRAAIGGGEGTGKSTLLREIAAELQRRGIAARWIGLPASATRRQRIAAIRQCLQTPSETIVLFDGYEQLGLWQRAALRRRRRLIATVHHNVGLPMIELLRPSETLFRLLLERLLDDISPATEAFALERFRHHRGDIRSTFFELYDAWADGRIDGRQRPEPCSAAAAAAITPGEL